MDHPTKPTLWYKTKGFYGQCKRVLKLTRKPTNFELKTIVQVCAIGMGFLGLLGFFISMINQLLFL